MNKRISRILIGFVLSFSMVCAGIPGMQWAAYAETALDNNAEDSASAEASASVIEETEMTDADSESEDEALPESETTEEEPQVDEESEEEEPVQAQTAGEITLDENIENGTIGFSTDEEGVLSGTATPAANYDLATIRLLYTMDGEQKETYIEYDEDDYSFSYNTAECEGEELVLTATFISTKVWDGGVDVTWYDPEQKSFDIYTPAQLAGVAAIVNGMVDDNETREDQIKDPLRTVDEEGNYKHEYIQTRAEKTRLLEQQGGGVEDIVYRLPEARTKGIFASDDLYNDMRYREIHLRADIDMGSTHNWTCIGGKHAMNVKDDYNLEDDPKVIDTRFQGVLDGHGHTVTINCNRYSHKGYGYSWNIGFVGYLGGEVDRLESNAKDNKIFYAAENHPTVRNVVVRGSVLGRRCTGGVVGRIGETNYSCIVENCANYATVMATDMRGCAGVVGAAWGVSVIRNCYNAGTIYGQYDEIGGIIGSNGYNYVGCDVFNCFNVGDVYRASVSGNGNIENTSYAGCEIGIDGDGGAAYRVQNCYYLKPSNIGVRVPGYDVSNNGLVTRDLHEVTSSEMKSDAVVEALNTNGNAFVSGGSLNNGYPVLHFEKDNADKSSCTVTAGASENGSVLINGESGAVTVPYGTIVSLKPQADSGFRWNSYSDGSKNFTGDFYTVTEDVAISGNFVSVETATIEIPTYNNYTVEVARTYNANTQSDEVEILHSGDTVYRDDILKVTGTIKKGYAPSDVDYEYSGKFINLGAENPASVAVVNKSTVRVTGEGDVKLILDAEMQKKDWLTKADTSWYFGHEKDSTYTLTTPEQLAGMARLICDGVDMDGTDFAGKTIKLGNDIDLTNNDGTDGKRLWRTVGNPMDTFRGTFDGNGHTISNIYVSFANPVYGHVTGSHGGLFGVAKGATIRNLNITGEFYATAGDTGAFVGNAIDTKIENCTADVRMFRIRETGGIVGKAEGTTSISKCTNLGSMSGTHEIGGIVGTIGVNANANSVRIESCVNKAPIESTYQYVGGIVALCETTATVDKCLNEADLQATQPATPDKSDGSIGGIMGTVAANITLTSCVNKGAIKTEGKVSYAGGIVGYINNVASTITDCYNTGSIASSANTVTGGLINVTTAKKLAYTTMTNCYNAGEMTTAAGGKAGGVAGQGDPKKFANNYYTEGSVANVAAETNVTGTKLTDDQMKQAASKLGASYIADTNNVNNGYPILAWQAFQVQLTKCAKTSNTAIALAWEAVEDVDGYKIYRATSASGTYKLIKTVDAGVTSYSNTGLTPGGWYYYKVRAFKGSAESATYGAYSAAKNVRLGLNKPTLKSVSNLKGRKAKVTWTKLSGATGYEVYRSTKKSSGYKKVKTITKGSTVTFTDSKLTKKKTYYYKIRAVSKVNSKTIYSTYSVVKYAKIKK